MARNFVRSDVLPLFQITKYHPGGLLFHYATRVRPELAGRAYTGPPQPTRGAQPMLAQFRSNPAAVCAAHSRGDVLFLPGRAARCTRRPSAGFPRARRSWCPVVFGGCNGTTPSTPSPRTSCSRHLPLRCLHTSAAALKPMLVVHTLCIPAVFEVGITPVPA
ncbi:hypothetical protein DFH06DRAFT_1171142, partial [Mycena polygramma]